MRYFIYFRDLPDAELRMIDGTGHWLLETHCARALPLVRNFRDCNLLKGDETSLFGL